MVAKNNLKSMQDNLLEFVVINFTEIFRIKSKALRTSTRKLLPPSLFEKIIFKSKEMKWLIHLSEILYLLPYRDKLFWKNLNLMLYPEASLNDVMDEVFLTEIGGLDYPIKSLVIYLINISEKGMKDLCTMGSVMEDLVLFYNSRTTMEFLNAPFPKLRKLHLVFADRKDRVSPYPHNPMHLDLTRFSNTLEELKLQNECIDDFTAKSIASLKNLKTLSIPFTNILNCDDFVSEIVGSMDQLRTLDVRNTNDRRPKNKISSQVFPLISKLSNLEKFEADSFICNTENLKKAIGVRRLKRFGIQEEELENWEGYLKYDEAKLLANEIVGPYPETLLSFAETYIDDFSNPDNMLEDILNMLPIVCHDQTEYLTRFENVLLRSCEKVDFCFARGIILMKYLESGRATLSLKTKILKIICCFHDNNLHLVENLNDAVKRRGFMILLKEPSISRTMLEIVEKNLNRRLSRKMLQSLLVHSYSHLHDVIQELGLNDVCKNALERSEFDQEAMNATKKLLKHIVDGLPKEF